MIMQARAQGRLGDRGRAGAAARAGSRSGAGRSAAAASVREHGTDDAGDARTTASSTAERPVSLRGCERHCALTRDAQAGRRDDPLRGRPGRRGRARRQAQAARPRHLDHRHPRRARGRGQAQRVRPRLQARRAGRRRSGGDHRAAAGARARSMRWRSPARPARWSAVSPRSRRRLAATTCWR